MSAIKKAVFFSILTVIVACFVIVIVYIFPRKMNVSLDGVMYRLGAENKEMANPITLHMKGYITTKISGEQRYNGTLDIDGLNIPVEKENRRVIIYFRDQLGWAIYAYNDKGTPRNVTLGMMKTNRNFSEYTLSIYDQIIYGDTDKGGSWSSKDGLMITAPAANREEAIAITKKVWRGEWDQIE